MVRRMSPVTHDGSENTINAILYVPICISFCNRKSCICDKLQVDPFSFDLFLCSDFFVLFLTFLIIFIIISVHCSVRMHIVLHYHNIPIVCLFQNKALFFLALEICRVYYAYYKRNHFIYLRLRFSLALSPLRAYARIENVSSNNVYARNK